MFNARFNLQKSTHLINYVLLSRNLRNDHRYTKVQISFLTENANTHSQRELTQKFNKHFGLNISVNRIAYALKCHKLRSKNAFYTMEQLSFLKENAKEKSNQELTDMFNARFDLHKSVSQIANTVWIRKFRYGVNKRTHHVSPVGAEHLSWNGITLVKTSDKPPTWRAKQFLIWEASNGAVPKGYRLIFADGNKQNFSIDNLALVSCREMAVMRFNGLRQDNTELTKTGIVIANILIKISDKQKKNYNNKAIRKKTEISGRNV